MAHLLMHQRTRPYRITRIAAGWVIWDRRHYLGTQPFSMPIGRAHPTHAAAIAALDAHLREQATKEDS